MSDIDPKAIELATHYVNEVMEYDEPNRMIQQIARLIQQAVQAERERIIGEVRKVESENFDLRMENNQLRTNLRNLDIGDIGTVYEQLKRRGGLWLSDGKGNKVLYSTIKDAVEVLLKEATQNDG